MKDGIVCYFDLLGFSDLSQKIEQPKYYKICKKIISDFHSILYKHTQNTNIQVSVLSDCAFIYSYNKENTDNILIAAANIMRESIKKGFLIRGGLCYDKFEQVETKFQNANILGIAVKNAVRYEETKGKGTRIFTDSNLHSKSNLCININNELISAYRNFSNYDTLDIFEWPLIYKEYCLVNCGTDINPLHHILPQICDLILDNFILLRHLIHSEDFCWNVNTEQGRIQVFSSIEYISSVQQRIFDLLGLKFSASFNIETFSKPYERKNTIRDSFIETFTKFVDFLKTSDMLEIKRYQDNFPNNEYLDDKLNDFLKITL